MAISNTQTTQLQTFLQAITFEGQNLVVVPYYTSSPTSDPYFFITPGSSDYRMIDTGTYQENRMYEIKAVFRADETTDHGVQITRINDLRDLIVAKIQTPAVRDSVVSGDVTLTQVSAPYQDDLAIVDGCVIIAFEIKVQSVSKYQ